MDRIESRLDKIEQLLTGQDSHIVALDKTLAINTEQLRLHIEGVKLAREQNELLRWEMSDRLSKVEDETVTVVAHVNKVQGVMQFGASVLQWLGGIAAVVGLIASTLKIVEFVKTLH